MGMSKNVTMSLSILFIAGCAPHDGPPKPKTIIQPLLQAAQRAHGVRITVDGLADAVRKAVDTQERGDTPP